MAKVRKNFVEALHTENSRKKTFTENGAIAYESSGKHLLDFNFKLSQYRNMNVEDIKKDFTKVYFENPLIAVKFIFYVGDIRGGLGERKVFNSCIEWLVENKPEIALSIIEFIPEYTRWDNLAKLATITSGDLHAKVISIIRNQLVDDMWNMKEGKNISLCAKWLPSINASSYKTRLIANNICNSLGFTPRKYRKMLSELRAYLDVVEVKMSANEWDKIDYSTVPSQANLKYSEAFLNRDRERRIEFLESLKRGEVKINSGVAQPHEIVRKYMGGYWGIGNYNDTLEEMWKSLPNIQLNDTLVVRDGSGSMCCHAGSGKTTCLDVATALAIYCAEHNSEVWKDKFITFSSRPEFVDLSKCKTLRDKLIRCYDEDDCSNTNIEATMQLILNTAVNNGLSQEEMPSNIVIISDMQFDARRYGTNWNETIFEQISKDYEFAGYKLPKICFWNVSSRNFNTIPMQNNELGLVLCSGFSTNNMKMFMSGEINPYKILIEQINNPRYNIIEAAVRGKI